MLFRSLSPFSRESIGTTSTKPANPFAGNTQIAKVENLPKVEQDFYPGDMVKHKMFGEGTITKVDKTEDDVFVTIDFKKGMTKKLSVRFAKLQKL